MLHEENLTKTNLRTPRAAALAGIVFSIMLKRFPTDLNRRDSQEVKDERVFVH
jgi:hypothetical protein